MRYLMKDSTLNSGLVKEIQKVRGMISDRIPYIKKDIENIIKNNIKSADKIERLLDELLNYGQLGFGEKEFKRLNKYYSLISKENSKSYDDFYKEMIK